MEINIACIKIQLSSNLPTMAAGGLCQIQPELQLLLVQKNAGEADVSTSLKNNIILK